MGGPQRCFDGNEGRGLVAIWRARDRAFAMQGDTLPQDINRNGQLYISPLPFALWGVFVDVGMMTEHVDVPGWME